MCRFNPFFGACIFPSTPTGFFILVVQTGSIYTHTYAYIYTSTYIYTHEYMYTHTYTHANKDQYMDAWMMEASGSECSLLYSNVM